MTEFKLAASGYFGITNQTDVFVIGDNGRLNMVSDSGQDDWKGPDTIGPRHFRPGASVAASQFDNSRKFFVFTVAEDGALNVFSSAAGNIWSGPDLIGTPGLFPSGAAVAAFSTNSITSVFAITNEGNLLRAFTDDGGTWSKPHVVGTSSFPPGGAVAVSKQFDTPNQTDVFAIDKSGTLRVFWAIGETGNKQWNGPLSIGEGFFQGAAVAATNQFGLPVQTDVFAVASNGALIGFWTTGLNTWHGPVQVSKSDLFLPGAAIAASNQFGLSVQTDVFAVDKSGALNVFWMIGDNKTWDGPLSLGENGLFPPGAPVAASNHFGISNRTDVFAVDNNGVLRIAWITGNANWKKPMPIARLA